MDRFNLKSFFLLFLIVLLGGILRLVWLDRFPPSLYTDEAAQGYNAYSILLTGRDEHGVFLPVSLRSFGDWKPPLPTYLMILTIKLFDLSEIAVRLPSAISGVVGIVVSYFLVKILLQDNRNRQKISLLTSFFMTVSPWHTLQSRVAMLVIIGLPFLVVSLFLFLKGLRSIYKLILSAVGFSLSIYSYYAMRIIVPLIIILLLALYRKEVIRKWKNFITAGFFGLVFLLPLFIGFLKEQDVIFGRARTVSVFYDQGIKLRQWELITQDGIASEPLITRFFHNNVYLFSKNIVQRLFSHFAPKYLLSIGDQAQPFQIPNMGLLYAPDLILFLMGILILYREKYQNRNLITGWLLISVIPASFTFMTPSSNRTFTLVTPLMVLISIGLVFLLRRFKEKKIFTVVLSLVYAISIGYFLKQYFIVLPKNYANFWNYGWKEVVQRVSSIQSCCSNVIVADINGMPYIYFLFYNKYDPGRYQKEAIRTYKADRFGFEHVEGFNNYLFPNNFEWKYVKEDLQKNTIYVVPADQMEEDDRAKETVYFPDGRAAYKIIQND